MKEVRTKAQTEFEARRKAFLDAEHAKLEEANKKVEDEVARLVAADSTAEPHPWPVKRLFLTRFPIGSVRRERRLVGGLFPI